ncbi:MAG: acyltransferase, partial [Chloroflexi bacterium]|nr:acyltransferase [Chloroflexota bacterium]
DVWIGAGVKILDGVVVSKGCVLAAGAVITHSTEPYGVYAGVPARRIKDRGDKPLSLTHEL